MAEIFEIYLSLSQPEADPLDVRKGMHAIVREYRQLNGYGSKGPMQYQILVEKRFQEL